MKKLRTKYIYKRGTEKTLISPGDTYCNQFQVIFRYPEHTCSYTHNLLLHNVKHLTQLGYDREKITNREKNWSLEIKCYVNSFRIFICYCTLNSFIFQSKC